MQGIALGHVFNREIFFFYWFRMQFVFILPSIFTEDFDLYSVTFWYKDSSEDLVHALFIFCGPPHGILLFI